VKSEREPIGLLRFVLTAALSVLPACSGGDGPIATICDGSTAIRFSFRNIGGGQVLPGSQVLSENGFNFLIVDGQCHFWARPDQDSDAREGDLSEERANRLSSTLKLSSWGKLRGDYTDSLCDGPTREYRFADSKIAVYSTCGGGSSPVNWLLNPALSQLQAIYDTGTPVGGPVRFVLMAEQDGVVWSSSVINLAAHWPLASDPASVAWTFDQANNYQPGSSNSAAPPDADALRSIRRSFVTAGTTQWTGGFVPILGPRDEQYEFFVRDSIGLEDAQGLLHLD